MIARLFGTEDSAHPLKLFWLGKLGSDQRERNEASIRALCANAYLGNDTLICRVLGRYKMFIDANDVGLSSHLLLDGYWEMWLTEALVATVKPGMTVFDIGANLGYFTLLMADMVGPQGHVHAFEPNPAITQRLRRSIAVNGFDVRVNVHDAPLSDGEYEVRLIVPEQEPKNSHLLFDSAYQHGIPLKTRRLDSYPDIGTPDVIKIDADTSEQQIWRGMSGFLEKQLPLIIFLEFHAARYKDAGAFLDEITAYGFSLAWLTINDGILPVNRAAILASPAEEDLMLVLRR